MYIHMCNLLYINILYIDILCILHVYIIHNIWYILYLYFYSIWPMYLPIKAEDFLQRKQTGLFCAIMPFLELFSVSCSFPDSTQKPFPLWSLFLMCLPRKSYYLLHCLCPVVSLHNFISISMPCKHTHLPYYLIYFIC